MWALSQQAPQAPQAVPAPTGAARGSLRYLMRGNAKLKAAARVWSLPVVMFVDDMKAAFNQFYLHPSQTWMTAILWLDLGVQPGAGRPRPERPPHGLRPL